ncbi:FAD-dependent monooxygenase [Corynebacterium uberis]|uniref:FAD-dependent monooxygenase n=1 Tax=Corynebacterium TaxID=1716 RepID=UPI001D0B5EEB|nr:MULTISPECIES: FAD-dependent monooxygenase [Corynebacterium]MCZ9310051.1 FAD-dependent monooxygenase [Corynebacterium sp. c6VSa_13]UDL73799.1 FAD-dependent monooxygenase [Corynebacterium uberis]UDL75318.1 FAD-dependent monooxygenase [Corynebacterium uberis]UDL77529.1 FAD-dependent monooxygenase [Corynebacterium uberis]UDL79816.1 FAD-dependent monooxygenase [Corynebacterium uberis]
MQIHQYGYISQNPKQQPAAGIGTHRPTELPDEMDVLIVGTGPAGMIAAAALSSFPNVHTRIIERRAHRLVAGQADGIQKRSVETFQAFEFANEIMEEAYHITEMVFWNPDPDNPNHIVRGGRPIDDEHGISEFPHIIVNQARVLDYFARFARWSPSRLTPDYGWEFVDLTIAEDREACEYPVTVRLRCTDTASAWCGHEREVKAKYVIGCDGARSKVRAAIGGRLEGKAANHAWGVMDVLAHTDFPDWRIKCAIHSKAGSILHIPREGGYLARIYVDLGVVPEDDHHQVRTTPIEEVIAKANEILAPYTLDVKHVAWSSIYEVGHRLSDGFCDSSVAGRRTGEHKGPRPRVFITGDACHTHSAKAGQGMNVSIQDGWNIAWKLGHVLDGRATPDLLYTYHDERCVTAENLINFDREWSTMMAQPVDEVTDPADIERFYVKSEEFAAGFLTEYAPSLATAQPHNQELAHGFPVGRRFKSARVRRVCDATFHHLGHLHKADGRWRIYVFADGAEPGQDSPATRWATWYETSPDSPRQATPPATQEEDAWFDAKIIYQQYHPDVAIEKVPEVFFPKKGTWALRDMENVFATLPGEDIFDLRGISRDGAVVVVRPDQYVAGIYSLEDTAGLGAFFAALRGQA